MTEDFKIQLLRKLIYLKKDELFRFYTSLHPDEARKKLLAVNPEIIDWFLNKIALSEENYEAAAVLRDILKEKMK